MFELSVAIVSALAVSSATALEISCEGRSPWTECLLFNSQVTCQIQANVKNLVKYCFDNATFVGNYSNHECSVKVENRNTNLIEEDSADWTCITTHTSVRQGNDKLKISNDFDTVAFLIDKFPII